MGCQTVQSFYMERQICDIGPNLKPISFAARFGIRNGPAVREL